MIQMILRKGFDVNNNMSLIIYFEVPEGKRRSEKEIQ